MKASHYRNAAVLGLLAKTWPRCFALFGHRRRPLKLGIRDDIVAALPRRRQQSKIRRPATSPHIAVTTSQPLARSAIAWTI
jgi:sRNA-binding protein